MERITKEGEMAMTITVGELIEILKLYDSDQPVFISPDRIKCVPVHGADFVRKIRLSGDKDKKAEEDSFVSIN